MKNINDMEKKPTEISETELEQVTGGGKFLESLKKVTQQIKDSVDLNNYDPTVVSNDTLY